MPFYTQTDLTNFRIRNNAPLTDAQILNELIEVDINSANKEMMRNGALYGRARHDIEDKDFQIWINPKTGKPVTLPNKANSRMAHANHRLQVVIKTSYLFKTPITITHESGDNAVDNFNEMTGSEFDNTMHDLGMEASNKGRSWIHCFFDEEGNFEYQIIDAIEVIPFYETSRQKKLTSLIRYFPMQLNIAGDRVEVMRVEWYFPDRVDIFESKDGGEFKKLGSEPHFTIGNTASPDMDGNPMSWGRVPFVEFKNNMDCLSDLNFIKSFIDALDLVDSQFANDLIEIQEAIVKASGTDDKPSEIAYNMKVFKVVVTKDEKSDIQYLTVEIPFEARQSWMDDVRTEIAIQGMSLDMTQDKFGQNPSGVAWKWMYLPLDLKASMLEEKFKVGLYAFAWFVNEAIKFIAELSAMDDDEIRKFSWKFNKSMIANEDEKIKQSNESVGRVSEQTRLENDPRVDDVAEEITRMDEERGKVNPAPVVPSNGLPAKVPANV